MSAYGGGSQTQPIFYDQATRRQHLTSLRGPRPCTSKPSTMNPPQPFKPTTESRKRNTNHLIRREGTRTHLGGRAHSTRHPKPGCEPHPSSPLQRLSCLSTNQSLPGANRVTYCPGAKPGRCIKHSWTEFLYSPSLTPRPITENTL